MTIFEKTYWVYILASKPNGTLYTGFTNNLSRRVYEHREGLVPGFTKQYGVKRLVYYEAYTNVHEAFHRETCIKEWKRAWKIRLIVKDNPEWHDLYETLAL